uniref:Retrovirus-related Pol polyprotein from transposon TNT 1-94 n=1 Tax=Tanacetum cinerariifolium TaxID=118510 RepID=A0A699HG43_TANCI|nr:retrovirus-related Pol polyprotein from transposon TNT 1-94 [Tanacetum cinerariifolium]
MHIHFTMHHLPSRLPSILHVSCMVSYKGDLYKLLLMQVIVAPTIPVLADSSEGNFIDTIDIGVDVIHPVPIASIAFPAATTVMTLALHKEAILGIQEHLLGVPILEELTALRFRVDVVFIDYQVLNLYFTDFTKNNTLTGSVPGQMEFRDESIDSAFDRFNAIITSLKVLDEGYSSKNYVRKFLKALHPKWREKFTTIEESKDLTSLSLDELIGNLKVHEMIIKKDSKIVKAKVKRKSLALKAKKESSDEECSTFGSDDEEYTMAIRDFKKFLKRRDKNQRAFFRGSWSDSGEEDDDKVKDETCLVAHASNEICLGVDLEPDEWIKDSKFSKHMTGNRKLFSTYKAYNGGNIIFGSNLRGNIIGKGQICDNKCRVTFFEHDSEITKDGKVIGNTLFTNKKSSNLIIVQIYVDDIIFGLTCQDTCDEFAKIMYDEFEISVMGELNLFLGLQIKQMKDGIFFNQSKYIKEMLKKFGLEDSKPMKTPIFSNTKLTKDEECESVDSTKYRGMIEQKPKRDSGTTRGRHSTSSSTFNQPSSFHLNDDDGDDDDGNNKGTSCASNPSPIRYVNSLTNEVLQVFQNPPNIDPHLEPFYTHQTEIINRQFQIQDEHHG